MKLGKLKLSWQDITIILIIIVYLIFQYNLVSSYEQLPSPLFGGDRYNQLGAVMHVRDGGDPFESYATDDPIGSYLPVYSLIVGNYARIFDLSGIDAMFQFSYIITILAVIIIYFFGKILFKNKSAALIVTLIFYNLRWVPVPIIKYRQFTMVTLFPLFFLLLYYTLKTREYKWAIATGLVYGIGSLAHGSMFLYILMFMPFLFIYMLFGQYVSLKKKKFLFNKKKALSSWKKSSALFFIILILGFSISLVYWALPLKYMFSGDPELREIVDLSRQQGRGEFYENTIDRVGNVGGVLRNFFASSFSKSPIIAILTILGLITLFFMNKWKEYTNFILLIGISTIAILFHFIITKPLLGIQAPVHEMISFIIPLLMFMLSGLFLKILFKKINKKYRFSLAIVLVLIVISTNLIIFNNYVQEDKWVQYGKNPLETSLIEASDYVIKNTDVNDVFITNHELGFALNGLTGRKLVSTPRGSHNTIIADLVTRDAHLSVLLYGKNNAERERLMKKYDVKYLFWYSYWLRGEFIFDQEGQVVGLFDPIEVLDKPEWREYLSENNVVYEPIEAELNPNKRGKVKKFDVLLVLPRLNITHPWDASLDEYLELKFEYPQDNPTVKIFKVDY